MKAKVFDPPEKYWGDGGGGGEGGDLPKKFPPLPYVWEGLLLYRGYFPFALFEVISKVSRVFLAVRACPCMHSDCTSLLRSANSIWRDKQSTHDRQRLDGYRQIYRLCVRACVRVWICDPAAL